MPPLFLFVCVAMASQCTINGTLSGLAHSLWCIAMATHGTYAEKRINLPYAEKRIAQNKRAGDRSRVEW